MLWGKKIVEVVGAPERCEPEEAKPEGPYRGYVPGEPSDPLEPDSLARTMYAKAKAATERKERERKAKMTALVRHTLDNILPYVLQKIDELADTGVVQSSVQSLLPAGVNCCFDTLATKLRDKGFLVDDGYRTINWDYSNNNPLDF